MAQAQFGSNSLSSLLALTGTSILGTSGAAGNSIQDLLGKSAPGFGFLQSFFSNWLKLDITSVAVALAIFGTISGALRELHGVALKAYWWITRFFTASISIASHDRLNREVINWLGAKILTRQGTRILTARSEAVQTDAWHYRRVSMERNDYHHEKRVPVEYLPTFGTTWFVHEGNVFMVRRVPTHSTRAGALATGVPDEYADAPAGNEPLVIMCLGRSVTPIKRFLDSCREFSDMQRASYITVRTSKDPYHRETWDTTILRPMRPLETVHFDEKTKAELVADITSYLQSSTRQFYTSRGIPYRRGFLLHGPPGTGKTSLSLALAGHFGLDLHILHIPGVREDNEMERLFTALPPRCIVLLEDIDAVGMKRQVASDDDENDDDDDDDEDKSWNRDRCRCTLSGLLNVLDGVASQEGRIVLMTSNFAEKLDPALVRPGRIDRKIFLGNISQRSAELMFLRMYPSDLSYTTPMGTTTRRLKDGELQNLALDFSRRIVDDAFTPAQLQGYLLNHRDNPATAASEAEVWVEQEIARMNEVKAIAKRARERKANKKKAKILAKIKKAGLVGVESADEKATITADETEKKDASKDGVEAVQKEDSKPETSPETKDEKHEESDDPSHLDGVKEVVEERSSEEGKVKLTNGVKNTEE